MPIELIPWKGADSTEIESAIAGELEADVAGSIAECLRHRLGKAVDTRGVGWWLEMVGRSAFHDFCLRDGSAEERVVLRWQRIGDAVRFCNDDLGVFGALGAGICEIEGPDDAQTRYLVALTGKRVGTMLWANRHRKESELVALLMEGDLERAFEDLVAASREYFLLDKTATRLGRPFTLEWRLRRGDQTLSTSTLIDDSGPGGLPQTQGDVVFEFTGVGPFARYLAHAVTLGELALAGELVVDGDQSIVINMRPPKWW